MSTPQTVNWEPWVYGEDGVALDDPAELFHEASRHYPHATDGAQRGLHLLEQSSALRASTTRAVKRNTALPARPLPVAPAPHLLAARRSERDFAPGAIELVQVATLLRAAYGVTHDSHGLPLRCTPSGGALYPLEVYVAATSVEGLEPALYHFDPLREALELIRSPRLPDELGPLTVYPELFTRAGVVFLVTALFWRTRFKYGLRGYRFALLEAGHLAQNLLLAATALDLASVPVGGFFDRRVDAFVGADGLDEATVYAVAVGARE